jgi:DNA repair protein RadC
MNRFIRDSLGQYQPASPDHILCQALQILESRMARPDTTTFSSPTEVKQFLKLKLGEAEREIFAVLFLDNRHRLIEYQELFQKHPQKPSGSIPLLSIR